MLHVSTLSSLVTHAMDRFNGLLSGTIIRLPRAESAQQSCSIAHDMVPRLDVGIAAIDRKHNPRALRRLAALAPGRMP
jgi:hypothetical protein